MGMLYAEKASKTITSTFFRPSAGGCEGLYIRRNGGSPRLSGKMPAILRKSRRLIEDFMLCEPSEVADHDDHERRHIKHQIKR